MSALDTARANLRETLVTRYMDRETLMDLRVVLDELDRLEHLLATVALDARIDRTREIIELIQEDYRGAAFVIDSALGERHPDEVELVGRRIREERANASS